MKLNNVDSDQTPQNVASGSKFLVLKAGASVKDNGYKNETHLLEMTDVLD